MKLVTVALCFTLIALATAIEFCSKQTLRECVSLQKCPNVWNMIEKLREDDNNPPIYAFLAHVKYNYYCNCYVKEKEPAIKCPHKLPKELDVLIPKKGENKNQLLSKNQKKKKHLDVCGRDYSNRMLKSGNRTDFTNYPWVALLQFEDSLTRKREFLCGGVLISDRHVLTAAHCVTSPSKKLISVRLGEYDTTTERDCIPVGHGIEMCKGAAKDVQVAEYILHPGYNDGISPRFDNSADQSDLALIKLKTKVKFSDDTRPICLPQKPELMKQRYEVAGWSTTMVPGAKSLPRKLRSSIYRISDEECWSHRINPEYSDSDHICAGGNSGEVCIADAGGPLMAQEKKDDGILRMTVFGIGFVELPCSINKPEMPSIFTKVHKYVPWIEEHIF